MTQLRDTIHNPHADQAKRSFLQSAGRFLYQKILTQPCCWMSMSPALRHAVFPTHNPVFELSLTSALVVGAVEGERAYHKWRGNTSASHSRTMDYGLSFSFMLATYAAFHALIPHDDAVHDHHRHHHAQHAAQNGETVPLCKDDICKSVSLG